METGNPVRPTRKRGAAAFFLTLGLAVVLFDLSLYLAAGFNGGRVVSVRSGHWRVGFGPWITAGRGPVTAWGYNTCFGDDCPSASGRYLWFHVARYD